MKKTGHVSATQTEKHKNLDEVLCAPCNTCRASNHLSEGFLKTYGQMLQYHWLIVAAGWWCVQVGVMSPCLTERWTTDQTGSVHKRLHKRYIKVEASVLTGSGHGHPPWPHHMISHGHVTIRRRCDSNLSLNQSVHLEYRKTEH